MNFTEVNNVDALIKKFADDYEWDLPVQAAVDFGKQFFVQGINTVVNEDQLDVDSVKTGEGSEFERMLTLFIQRIQEIIQRTWKPQSSTYDLSYLNVSVEDARNLILKAFPEWVQLNASNVDVPIDEVNK